MAYFRTDGFIGGQSIADTSTTALHTLGTIVPAKDTTTYGGGEFIYLLGVADTVVGSVVTYHPATWQTALCPVGNNLAKPIAIAMSANVAGQYGWYQISGLAVAAKSASICCVAGAGVAVKTIGLISKTGTGTEIQGAVVATTGSAKTGVITVLLSISRPHMQGRVT
jgi:hypothetical protein